jgi:NAD(P)-dependent dehydrogenase (short-subunit alcohol dehydrogenase family)
VAGAALVLGGSGGIGLAIAAMLREEGYDLTIQGRREERVEDARARLGEDVETVAADLGDEAAIAAAVAAHAGRWGRMDVLVDSAGFGIGQDVGAIQTRHLDLQLAVNFRAAVIALRESLPLLEAAGAEHGRVLVALVSSWAGSHPPAWLSVYGASKAALNSFARSAQLELGGKGIQVAAVSPATVETEMTRYAEDEIPAAEMLRPSDVAEAVRLLLRLSPTCRVPEIQLGRAGDLPG